MRNVVQLCLTANNITILLMLKWNPLLRSLLCENGAQNGRFELLENKTSRLYHMSYFKLFKHIPSLGIYNFSKMADIF